MWKVNITYRSIPKTLNINTVRFLFCALFLDELSTRHRLKCGHRTFQCLNSLSNLLYDVLGYRLIVYHGPSTPSKNKSLIITGPSLFCFIYSLVFNCAHYRLCEVNKRIQYLSQLALPTTPGRILKAARRDNKETRSDKIE